MNRVELFTTVFRVTYFWKDDKFYRQFPTGVGVEPEETLFDLVQWSLSNEYLHEVDLQACRDKGLNVSKAQVR